MSDPGPSPNDQPPTRAAVPAPAKRKPLNPRLRLGLMIGGAGIAVVGLVFGLEWFLHGRFIISTENAYLRADSVTVSPRVTGYIDEIYVKENQHVTLGQPLLHIDKRNYQDTVSQQNASVAARIADLDAADSQIHRQQAEIAQSRAQVESAREKAKFARVQGERYTTLL